MSKPKKSPAEQLKELERKNRELQKELEFSHGQDIHLFAIIVDYARR